MQTYLGLGSNLGKKEHNINFAIQQIAEQVGRIMRQSTFYHSAPVGFSSDNQFVNAVVLVETQLEPLDLLHQLQYIEREMGRTSKTKEGVYEDRIIDIDILLYDNLTINLPELTIPHPRMQERDFVMKPLREIQC